MRQTTRSEVFRRRREPGLLPHRHSLVAPSGRASQPASQPRTRRNLRLASSSDTNAQNAQNFSAGSSPPHANTGTSSRTTRSPTNSRHAAAKTTKPRHTYHRKISTSLPGMHPAGALLSHLDLSSKEMTSFLAPSMRTVSFRSALWAYGCSLSSTFFFVCGAAIFFRSARTVPCGPDGTKNAP